MANNYYKGQKVRCTGTFTTSAGTAVDPTAVVFITKDPDGTMVGYHYGLSSLGSWSAATNSPALADGTGTAGKYYTVSAAGSVDFGSGSITFAVGDYVFYNGSVWQRLPSPSSTTPTKSSTGIYYVDIYASISGDWYYRCEGLGTGQSAAEESFAVKDSEFD